MPAPDAPRRDSEKARTWTLLVQDGRIDVRFHPTPGPLDAWLRGVLSLVTVTALAATLVVLVYGSLKPWGRTLALSMPLATVAVASLTFRRSGETLVIGPTHVVHTCEGHHADSPWRDELELSSPVTVETDDEPWGGPVHRFLAWGASARPTIAMRVRGRTLRVGYGLGAHDARRLRDAIRNRLDSTLAPVPGRPGVVQSVGVAVRTGRQRLSAVDALARIHPLDAVGGVPAAALLIGLFAVVGGVIHTAAVGLSQAPFSSSLALVALTLLVTLTPRYGLVGQLQESRVAHWRATAPDEPWAWHARWREGREVRHSALSRKFLVSAAALSVLVALLVRTSPSSGLAPLRLAMVAAVVAPLALRVWQLAYAGSLEVRYATLPLVPGRRAEFRVALSRLGAGFVDVSFRLLRTELRQASHPFHGAYHWTTHEALYRLPADQPPPGAGEEVAVLFDLPRGAGPTDHDALVPVRWYLEVRGHRAGAVQTEVFEVPVFRESATPAPARQ